MKLLIAEDDAFFRKMLQKLLHSEFDIISAKDGTQAWRLLQQNDWPMMAILDWVMPGLSGPEVCREARLCPKTAHTYLILLTARNSAEDIVAGLRAGADDYVTKPFEAEDLCARVRLGRRIVELQGIIKTQIAENAEMRARGKAAQSESETFSHQRHVPRIFPFPRLSR